MGILAAVAGYGLTLLPFGNTTVALAMLVTVAVLIDFGLTLNVVIGQRAIYGLAPDLRSRLNGLFGASAFIGGALGSALGGWAYAHGDWSAAAALDCSAAWVSAPNCASATRIANVCVRPLR